MVKIKDFEKSGGRHVPPRPTHLPPHETKDFTIECVLSIALLNGKLAEIHNRNFG